MEDKLILSCKSGDIETITNILENNKTNIKDININYNNLFNISCFYGHIDIVKYLIDYCDGINSKIDIHNTNEKAFENACYRGFIEIVKYLIDYGHNAHNKINIHVNNDIAFRQACSFGFIDLIKYLLEYGNNNNSKIDIHIENDDAIRSACLNGHINVIKYLCEYCDTQCNYECSKIHLIADNDCIFKNACNSGSTEVLQYIISRYEKMKCLVKTNINSYKLFYTIDFKWNTNMFKYLIEYTERINNRLDIGYNLILCNCYSIENFNKIVAYLIYLYKHNYNSTDYCVIDFIYCWSCCDMYIKKRVSYYNTYYIINNCICHKSLRDDYKFYNKHYCSYIIHLFN